MKYNIIQPPFTLKFREMSRKELREYYQWFLDSIPERLAQLVRVVKESADFHAWEADYSPDSLSTLGAWFAQNVETRERTEEELCAIKVTLSLPMEVAKWELTNRTFSLAIDVGMYTSRVFLQNFPTVRWKHCLGGKTLSDYGQPVLEGFGKMQFNPVHMMVVHAYALADKTRGGDGLRRIYDIWSELVVLTK